MEPEREDSQPEAEVLSIFGDVVVQVRRRNGIPVTIDAVRSTGSL